MQLSKKALGITPSLTLGIDALSKQMKKEGKDVVGFGAGEPDFDTPEYIKKAAVEALEKGATKYTPVSGTLALREAVCNRYERKYGLSYQPSQVVVSSGAKHSLYNVFQAILNPGDEVVLIVPYWLTYPEQIKMAGGVPVYVEAKEENDFQAQVCDIKKVITDKTRAIVVNSPSNPCGNVYSIEEMRGIAQLAEEHDFFIVADEIYDELMYVEYGTSIATVSDAAKERTIVVNGMSKAYAMTGWRIGYTIAPEEVAKVMTSYQSHSTSNPCSIAQYASVAALEGDQGEVERMVEVFRKRGELMYKLVNEIPHIHCRMPGGAFYIFINIKDTFGKQYNGKQIRDSISFSEILLKEKLVAVVPGIAFGAEGYIRLSYATCEENIKKGLERIGEFCRALA